MIPRAIVPAILICVCAWSIVIVGPGLAQDGDEPVHATDLFDIREVGDVHVSPDGRQVAYTVRTVASDGAADPGWDSLSYRTHIYVADAAGSTAPRQLTRGDRSASNPAWSPSADRLAFVRDVDDTPQVFVLPLAGGEAHRVTDLEHGASDPKWSPDGSSLLVTSAIPHGDLRDRMGDPPPWAPERPGRTHERADDPAAGDPEGSLESIRAWLEQNARGGDPRVFTRLDLQGEHDLEAAPSYRHLFVVDVDTMRTPRQITDGYADFSTADWLPDGDRVVAAGQVYGAAHPDRSRARRLYAVDAGGGGVRLALDLPGFALDAPTVSPTGRVVAFTARDTADVGYAQTELGVFTFERPESARILTDSLDRSVSAPVWTPDGWFVYFTAPSNGGVPLYRTHPFELAVADTAADEAPDDTMGDAEGADTTSSDEDAVDSDTTAADGDPAAQVDAADAREEDTEGAAAAEPGRAIEIERLTSFDRGIRSFDVGSATVFFAATDPANPYELYAASLSLGNERRLTAHNADWIARRRLSMPERRILVRDSLEIEYWVMKPAFLEPDRQYPLLLQIHGGPMSMWGPGEATMWHELQFFASKGYGIVFSNPRGSGGYGYDVKRANYRDWGRGPATDVLAAANAADDLPWVDSTRQVVTGGSYAGYLTAWIVAHDDRFRAAVAQRGVYDLPTFLGEGNAWRLVPSHFGGFPWEAAADTASADTASAREVLARNSPITYVQRIDTPLLIIHADHDLRTGVSQSEMLYRSLKILGRPVEYARYPDAGHDLSRTGNPKQRVDRILRMYEFFERFVR